MAYPPTAAQWEAFQQDEKKQIHLNRKNIATWYALCKRQDKMLTEVIVERVDISITEQNRLLCAMKARILRQQTEHEDIRQDHEMPIPLSYTKRRGSACSSQSTGSAASMGSVCSADIGEGGFKPWSKSKYAEESDVW
jgi:hypothetical protein